MLLKKQTVWLLTMLSLVFVLSVYYFLGNQADNQMASDPTDVPSITETAGDEENTDGDEDEDATAGVEGEEAEGSTEEDNAVVNYISSDETFAELRLDLENLRSKTRSDLNDQIANAELPAEVISQAKDQLDSLSVSTEKEFVLESSIKSRKDVDDAFVRVTGEQVKVTVKVNGEHTPKMANEIYHLVRREFTDVRNENIAFEFTKDKN